MKDEVFIRGKVPMTKAEVRAASIDLLGLDASCRKFLDVGAGTGSVGLQVAYQFPEIKVTAIERNPDAVDLIKQNQAKFGLENVAVIEAYAPIELAENDTFDAIFIGGSGGNLTDIIDWSLAQMNPGGRLVLNFILLENALTAMNHLEKLAVSDLSMKQIQVSSWHKLGAGHYFEPQNPTIIIGCKKLEE
ncbi:decarboxylating cobalt-precorrin-6B (C(15))-methyltransferase [Listeria swaminathanii]|uniref:Decarboxylating cobalt-precorrin-6B (C(15))-methyltransferase n=1 Tax=Listeria swaminathanii TaxID=2713501 RepID=A0ABU2IC37_9LIST|nr:decarboxylating cobalt-precorrin-6B (C(15))-methyltransferase [Listeria swaminathanii]MDT0016459.1 decarboxylating cobalt-precorrin-6B (C(15))-methyltransferase [Listeria swaminathanii]MDT0021895.1 decarboxylating cobalt-precorrin-6B (C(15))-methyltransferase [Listeria swaminathanii]MDT0032859.1 decarboxylating cobalt-precorrin-6B (C(15))-methyltransferase [Listeria swaminathanii]MDT0051291.1 decarboxylating cobalt-precorrin-6B (C(15))-methyltransferase [Listeria swaminathanii]MDT0054056.1 